jgi:HEAT repeat protein
LTTFVQTDDQPTVRVAAIAALGSVASSQSEDNSRKSIAVLVDSLQKDDYEGARAEAASVLGNIPAASDIAIPALLGAIKDGYALVSNAAFQALGSYGDKSGAAVPELVKFIQSKPGTTETCNALRALGRMKSAAAEAVPAIVTCLQSGEPQMLNAALTAVESLGPVAAPAVKQLIALLASPEISVRYRAIRALGEIGPQASEAVSSLRELSKAHANESAMVNQALRKITGESIAETSQTRRHILVVPHAPAPGGSESSSI